MPTPRSVAIALATVAVAAATGLPVSTAAQGAPVEVSDATFAWSLNDQTNARSHNPVAINFLAAGVADPGRGGAALPASSWQATAGNVTIQKLAADGSWQRATWAGLGTDASGASIGIHGPYSGHRVQLSAGVGTLDADTDSARLAWSGTFTVVYYGGNSVFTVTDPVLEVTAGAGTVTGVLGGWSADRTDPTVWQPVAAQRVAIADLAGVDVTEAGLVTTPAYAGVSVEGSVPQHRSGLAWGSFPASMVAFLAPLGVDQFWYSTGLQSDGTKVPAPITVGLGAGPDPASPSATPTKQPTKQPTRQPTPQNQVTPPPTSAPRSTSNPPAPTVTVTETAQPATDVPTAAAGVRPAPDLVQVSATTPATVGTPAAGSNGTHPAWWLGGALLLGAAALLLAPTRRRS